MRARGWRAVAAWLSWAKRNGSTAARRLHGWLDGWLDGCLYGWLDGRLHLRLHVCLIRVFELGQAIDQRHLAQSSEQATADCQAPLTW